MNQFFTDLLALLTANGYANGVPVGDMKIAANGAAIYVGDQNQPGQNCHFTAVFGGGLGCHFTINHVNYPRIAVSTILGCMRWLAHNVHLAPMEEGEIATPADFPTLSADERRAMTVLNQLYWMAKNTAGPEAARLCA